MCWELELKEVFFLPLPILMVSDGCGLSDMICALLCEFNVELSFVVPFPSPSEALGVGTWRSIFSSRYISNGLGWILDIVWMGCNVHYRMNSMSNCPLYSFISNTFLGVESWIVHRELFYLLRSNFHGLGWLWFGWAPMYIFVYFQNKGAMWLCLSCTF